MLPGRKVSVAALAGFITTIAFWLLGVYVWKGDPHLTPPPEVIAAVTGVLIVGLAYLIPAKDQAP